MLHFPLFHSWRYCIVTKIVLEFYVNGLIALSVKTALPPHYLKIIGWADKYQMTRSNHHYWYWGEVPCLCLWGGKCPNQTVDKYCLNETLILMIWWKWRFWGRGRQGKCLRFLRGKVCQLRAWGLQGTFSLHAIQRANSPRPCKQLQDDINLQIGYSKTALGSRVQIEGMYSNVVCTMHFFSGLRISIVVSIKRRYIERFHSLEKYRTYFGNLGEPDFTLPLFRNTWSEKIP